MALTCFESGKAVSVQRLRVRPAQSWMEAVPLSVSEVVGHEKNINEASKLRGKESFKGFNTHISIAGDKR